MKQSLILLAVAFGLLELLVNVQTVLGSFWGLCLAWILLAMTLARLSEKLKNSVCRSRC